MAKQRIRKNEGVRIEGDFTKVNMIKRFKMQATREETCLTSSNMGVGLGTIPHKYSKRQKKKKKMARTTID
ncbi:hypothetical protein AC249_AIPGENE8190 [Exaiptasia diaphana]|nr:hypothetical protein AC249_AIPGENE8190 [Exaiptasia diaphana]